jgi:hypothetical protein
MNPDFSPITLKPVQRIGVRVHPFRFMIQFMIQATKTPVVIA